jgi:hypothetical protein
MSRALGRKQSLNNSKNQTNIYLTLTTQPTYTTTTYDNLDRVNTITQYVGCVRFWTHGLIGAFAERTLRYLLCVPGYSPHTIDLISSSTLKLH